MEKGKIWSWTTMSIFLIATFNAHIKDADALRCFKCLALDCPGDKELCEDVRNFLSTELRSYYYVDTDLLPCPGLTDTEKIQWSLKQLDPTTCPEMRRGGATCALGRLEVISEIRGTGSEANSVLKRVISYGTMLGCANLLLLNSIKTALVEKHGCDLISVNDTGKVPVKHYLSLEHCSQISDLCHDRDYCIHPRESIVKTFKNQNEERRFEFGLVVAIGGLVAVVVLAIMGATMCWSPLNRVSNFTTSSSKQTLEEIPGSFKPIGDANIDNVNSRSNIPSSSFKILPLPPPLPVLPPRKSSYV